MSPEELAQCAARLRDLAANPADFLDKGTPQFEALAEIRREANRLIEAVKNAVRVRRGQIADPSIAASHSASRVAPGAAVHKTIVRPSSCYSCTDLHEPRHPHYRWMCQACGDWNWQKRHQQADLTGRVAVVTGGRVQIGYQVCLKLLRAGAAVHAVTRFPYDAVDRYARESDFDAWSDRLTIHGLDLRNLRAVEQFAAQLAVKPLDILINNAAQTIRPAPDFIVHMLAREYGLRQQLSQYALRRIDTQVDCERITSGAVRQIRFGSVPVATLPPEESDRREPAFEFIDQRPTNSWVARIDDVAPVETLEVHFVNALAPFLLIQGLLPAIRRAAWPRRFIVNVAAREGQFAGKPTSRHPHTNMAKAALNMLTRTLAADLRQQGIHINSVDPGWVSDQRPHPTAQRWRESEGDWLPLDAIDAAARVLDPVFTGASAETPVSGKLFRNYQVSDW